MSVAVLEQTHQGTSTEVMDKALAELNERRSAWASLSINDRIGFIDQMRKDFSTVLDDWVDAALKAKGGVGDPAHLAQEWFGGPFSTLRNLSLLKRSLEQIRDQGKPKLPGKAKKSVSGKTVVPVFPTDLVDRALYMGITAEIWLQDGVTPDNLDKHLAQDYQQDKAESEICLVLGAGNVSSIGPMDCFYKLFNEKKLCILKMHPVNAYLGPFFEKGFASLIDAGYVRIVYGDAAEGSYLCNHDLVHEIHITGSDKTHDIIVFGKDVEARKAAREPFLDKPITSELGNVSPVIVAPGQWSDSDLVYHARSVVSSLMNNAGFNCNATRVLITHKDWAQRETFLGLVSKFLKSAPLRKAYYPGAQQRYDTFLESHPDAQQYGERTDEKLPWMFVTGLDPKVSDDVCFGMEAFCGVFGEVALEADSVSAYFKAATDFANDTLWGTLNATIIADSKTQSTERTAFEQMVADLRYGTVGINQWAALGYALCSTTWGAYPEHDIYDIKSGLDVVHNTYMFSKVDKSVVRTPFRQFPEPVYFYDSKTAHKLGRKLSYYEADRSLLRLPGIMATAMGL